MIICIMLFINMKTVYCEETTIINIYPEILEKVKQAFIESLIDIKNQEAFKQQYGGSAFFNFMYLSNSFVISFVEHLPLNEIINKYSSENLENFEKINNHILQLFFDEISQKKNYLPM